MPARRDMPEYKLCLRYIEEHQPVKVRDLLPLLGVTRRTLQWYLTLLHEERKAYISHWERNYGTGGDAAPMWSLGGRRHATKPPRLSRAETVRRWRQKHAASQQVQRRLKNGTLNAFQQLVLKGPRT